MTAEVECQLCRKPVRSVMARARRIGSGCWRKLRPDQRTAITTLTRRGWSLGPAETRAALSRARPAGAGQTVLPADPTSTEENRA